MRETGLMFKAPLVRAILAGKKTQTRRLVKPQPVFTGVDDLWAVSGHQGGKPWVEDWKDGSAPPKSLNAYSPFGGPGDRIWVRETFAKVHNTAGCERYGAGFDPTRSSASQHREGKVFDTEGWRYRATWDRTHSGPWTPAIHMPRDASRILLEVVTVRAERLQAISAADAAAEGLTRLSKDGGRVWKYGIPEGDGMPGPTGWQWRDWEQDPREAFRKLWDQLAPAGAKWIDNPWVWVAEFKAIEIKGKILEGPPAYAGRW